MVPLSEIKKEIIRKTMLKPSLPVILKGIYRYRYTFTYEYRWGQRSLNLVSLGKHL